MVVRANRLPDPRGNGGQKPGAIAAPPALINAITHALGTEIDMPASREKVWRACQNRTAQAAE